VKTAPKWPILCRVGR